MKRFRNILLLLITALLIAAVLRGAVFTSFLIPSAGMEPALKQGEQVIAGKWSYGLRLPLMSLWGYQRWGERAAARHDILLFNNPADHRQPLIDRREVFIGRLTGLPGDTLWADTDFTQVITAPEAPDRRKAYRCPNSRRTELDSLVLRLHLPRPIPLAEDSLCTTYCFSLLEHYLLQQALYGHCWIEPAGAEADSLCRFHPLVIPAKGKPVKVTPWNITLLCNTLRLHEQRSAEIRQDTLLCIDGQPVQEVTFTQDYHWVTSDNPANIADSRLFGFLPKSHIIGRATHIGLSLDKDRGWSDGKIRWKRMFKRIE
ncbi:MAG: S26 family signal peptidase [Bacteroides sp.]|nr:S26 family signal peptidase [Bacteroides sp.]